MCGSLKEAFVAHTGMGQAHCNALYSGDQND
jgi:hypothetical protein